MEGKYIIILYLSVLFIEPKGQDLVLVLSTNPSKPLFVEVQRCFVPNKIIHKVERYGYPDLDPISILSYLILVRLLKHIS